MGGAGHAGHITGDLTEVLPSVGLAGNNDAPGASQIVGGKVVALIGGLAIHLLEFSAQGEVQRIYRAGTASAIDEAGNYGQAIDVHGGVAGIIIGVNTFPSAADRPVIVDCGIPLARVLTLSAVRDGGYRAVI